MNTHTENCITWINHYRTPLYDCGCGCHGSYRTGGSISRDGWTTGLGMDLKLRDPPKSEI